eukprot:COSAG02_NODE_1407_length_12764_cov_3781.882985_4_plen_305_part_00
MVGKLVLVPHLASAVASISAHVLDAPGWLPLQGTVTSGELNYCSKIEDDTNYIGNDLRYENRSNHWFPATVSTCCASCRNSKSDPGAPAECVCWVWGYNNNADCRKDNFKEDEGCCWLKRADANGGVCQEGRSDSKAQMSGHFTEGKAHDGGLPDHASSGWAVVTIIMGFAFVGTAYSRVSPGFAQNLKSLVADGVTFTISSVRGQGEYVPIKREATQHVDDHTGGSGANNRNAVSASSGASSGQATALHAAAAIGETRVTDSARGVSIIALCVNLGLRLEFEARKRERLAARSWFQLIGMRIR